MLKRQEIEAMPATRAASQSRKAFTPRTLDASEQIAEGKVIARLPLGAMQVEAVAGRDTLWIIVRRPGHGAVAMKTARSPGPVEISGKAGKSEGSWRIDCTSGRFDVSLVVLSDRLVRVCVELNPSTDLLVPFWSRDLYPLGANDDPRRAEGRVEAAQRGHNSGLCYFTLSRPAFGTVLYFQNLTALNPYFAATGTKPDGVVGGEWPELGYQPPTAPLGNSPPVDPLKKGVRTTISDAFVCFGPIADTESGSAELFLDMLAEIYMHLERPDAILHDWPARARRTARDLTRRPEALITHYGCDYLRPYVEAEYPDSMVQLTVLTSLREYEARFGQKLPIADRLARGVPRFFDRKLGALRRYLPNVGDDKNADAVDSWYLYHPLMNLARLAERGDVKARELFLASLNYAVRAAQHFAYRWPIQFDVRNFSVITPARDDRGLGQTDVGGLYAYVMLKAHELTGDDAYLDDAKAALKALRHVRFELVYQANLTAWGAVACISLWRREGRQEWLEQAQVFVAGFMHNCEIWDSRIAHARHYTNFFGATCLHDGPYMSAFECFESFAAFDELLTLADGALPMPMWRLITEYRRFTLYRAGFWYPDALPPDAVAQDKIRNGHIDCKLSFPVEDIYGDGQPAGQVGQEIYGSGGAFVFASRAYHGLPRMPFQIFTPYPADVVRTRPRSASLKLKGLAEITTKIGIVSNTSRALPRIAIRINDDSVRAIRVSARERTYETPGKATLTISWRPAR